MGIEERSAERRKRIVGNRAKSFAEAEEWDLQFWQSLTPGQRLSALVDLRDDIAKVLEAKAGYEAEMRKKAQRENGS
jgi:hypothetical protein